MADQLFGTDIKGKAVISQLYSQKREGGRPKDEITKNKNILYHGNSNKVSVRDISARVQRELKNYDNGLDARRKKLKLLLDGEENCYLSEYRQCSVKNNILRNLEAEKERMANLELEEIKETEEFLATKQLQLDMSKCKAIGPLLKKRREMEIRQMQQMQMQEKKEMIQNEKEANKTWHYVMKKDVEAKILLEERVKMEQARKVVETRAFLDNQMQMAMESQKKKILQEREEERRIIDNLKVVTAKELQQESEKILNKKVNLGRSLKQQMAVKNQTVQKMSKQEKELETYFARVSMDELNEDTKKMAEKKEQEKRELDLFAEHFAAVRAERESQQRSDDIMVASVAEKYIEESEKQRCLLEKQRRELLKEALTGRHLQMQEKMVEAQRANMESTIDKELRIEQAKQAADMMNMNKQKDRRSKEAYRHFLENQMRMAKIAKEKVAEEKIIEFNRSLEQEQQYNEKMVALMNREFATEGVHPFMTSVRKAQSLKSPPVPETNYNKY